MHRMIKPMSNMDLDDALDTLQSCSALILDGDILMYPRIIREIRNDDNEKLFYLEWIEGEQSYEICFLENDNQVVGYSGSNMFLTDENGEEVQITILTEKRIGDELQDSE